MTNPFGLTYFDRSSGKRRTERVCAARFLHWSYNSPWGRVLTKAILARPFVSRVCGWLARGSWSRRFIGPFARNMSIDLGESNRFTRPFSCFNDFFIREYARPVQMTDISATDCVAPAESKVLVLRNLHPRQTIRVKRNHFNLRQLLGDERLCAQLTGGTAVICRLGLADYHHFHFPVSGTPGPARGIPGKLFAGGPYSLRWPTSFYAENHRMVTVIESDAFGTVAQVEIGAFTVGSIRQQYTPGAHVSAGQKKGYFELGGSTIVLVFAAHAIDLDADLCSYSDQHTEARVQLCESIGRSAQYALQVRPELCEATS